MKISKKISLFISALSLSLLSTFSLAQLLATENNYSNENIGVRAEFNDNWTLSTSFENAPAILKPNFPENKGPDDSPLLISIHDNQQLFARILVEPYFGNLESYAALLAQGISTQGIEIISAKSSLDGTSVELHYRHSQLGLMFRERIALSENSQIIRMALWSPQSVFDSFSAEIEAVFDNVELTNIINASNDSPNQWRQLSARLQADNIAGISIVEPDNQIVEALVCEQEGNTMLWQVESANQDVEVYLFGSLHVGKAEFYPLKTVVEEAFREAQHLVFEVDPRSAADPAIAQSLQTRGMLTDGQTLVDLLSGETVSNLREVLRNIGIPADSFLAMKPWFLSLVLQNLQINALGYSPQFGIENYLFTEIPPTSDILELESIEEQIGFLEQMNTEIFLNYTLESFSAEGSPLEDMIHAWQCADKSLLTDMLFEDFSPEDNPSQEEITALEDLREMLFFERNITMADGVKEFLENGQGSYFVVVGSGHLLGDKSVIDLLNQEGYQINAISQ